MAAIDERPTTRQAGGLRAWWRREVTDSPQRVRNLQFFFLGTYFIFFGLGHLHKTFGTISLALGVILISISIVRARRLPKTR